MNAPVSPASLQPRRSSVDDIFALIEKGVIHEDAAFELLDGEIVPMAPKGPLHEDVRVWINRWLKRLPDEIAFMVETTLRLDPHSFVEPDYILYPADISIKALRPADIFLAIEVADSSWTYDITTKAPRYAAAGIQEYWVINAVKGGARVHRGPGPDGYASVINTPTGAPLACAVSALPELILPFE